MTQPVDPIVTDEMRQQLAVIRNQYKTEQRYIAELKANVTGYMEGTIENWPSHIQDQVYKALDRTSLGSKYEIKMSYCDHTPEDGFFVHVIATAMVKLQS